MMFYYAIYAKQNRKMALLEKSDFESIQSRFVFMTTYLKSVRNECYRVMNGRRILSSFDARHRGKETHFVFKQFKKRKIVPSALK